MHKNRRRKRSRGNFSSLRNKKWWSYGKRKKRNCSGKARRNNTCHHPSSQLLIHSILNTQWWIITTVTFVSIFWFVPQRGSNTKRDGHEEAGRHTAGSNRPRGAEDQQGCCWAGSERGATAVGGGGEEGRGVGVHSCTQRTLGETSSDTEPARHNVTAAAYRRGDLSHS